MSDQSTGNAGREESAPAERPSYDDEHFGPDAASPIDGPPSPPAPSGPSMSDIGLPEVVPAIGDDDLPSSRPRPRRDPASEDAANEDGAGAAEDGAADDADAPPEPASDLDSAEGPKADTEAGGNDVPWQMPNPTPPWSDQNTATQSPPPATPSAPGPAPSVPPPPPSPPAATSAPGAPPPPPGAPSPSSTPAPPGPAAPAASEPPAPVPPTAPVAPAEPVPARPPAAPYSPSPPAGTPVASQQPAQMQPPQAPGYPQAPSGPYPQTGRPQTPSSYPQTGYPQAPSGPYPQTGYPAAPQIPDAYGVGGAFGRLSPGAQHAGRPGATVLAAVLDEGDVVDLLIQGQVRGRPGVAALVGSKMVLVNAREWEPEVVTLPITATLQVQGMQQGNYATLVVTDGEAQEVIDGIADAQLAIAMAERIRARVATVGAGGQG